MLTLTTLSIYSILLPLIIGVVFLKKLSKDSLLIWGVVAVGTIPQLMKPYFEKEILLNIAYNVYIILEFVLFFYFFQDKFYNKRSKQIFKITSFSYIILSLPILVLNGITNEFLNYLICINSLAFICWILMLVLEQYGSETGFNIMPSISLFWFLSGMLFYYPCTIMVFLFWQQIHAGPKSIEDTFTTIHSIFNINLYLFFSIGFWQEIKLSKTKSSIV